MAALSQRQVTQLLVDWSDGDTEALNDLMPHVYQELKRLARYHMRRERADHTLQTSALVNDAYIRLVDYPRGGDLDQRITEIRKMLYSLRSKLKTEN